MGAPRLRPALLNVPMSGYTADWLVVQLIAKPGNHSWLAGGGRPLWGRQGCTLPCEYPEPDALQNAILIEGPILC